MPLWHGSIYIQERMRTILQLYKRFAWDEDGLPSGAAGVYVSPDVSIDNAANTLRFECESNWTGGSFFVWSEFSLFILSE